MEYSEKCDFCFKLIDKVDFYWNFMFIATSSVLLLLVSKTINVDSFVLKICVTIIYFSFILCNMLAHVRAYQFLSIMLEEVKKDADRHFNSNATSLLSKLSYQKGHYRCIAYYSITFIVSAILFWLN